MILVTADIAASNGGVDSANEAFHAASLAVARADRTGVDLLAILKTLAQENAPQN